MTDVECSACGAQVGRGPGGLGMVSHWNKHRRDWMDAHDTNRRPGKTEICEWLNGTGGFDGTESIEDAQTRLGAFTFRPASEHYHP